MGPVIINASCTFLAPVNYPATVVIKMYAGDPGRSSVMTWYELFVDGDERLYAEGASNGVDGHAHRQVGADSGCRARAVRPARGLNWRRPRCPDAEAVTRSVREAWPPV